MIRIKSLRPSRLIISDSGLKLMPGQGALVESLSPQTKRLIDKGYLVQLAPGEEPSPVPVEISAQPKTSHKDGLLHSYKTDDTLHFDGQIDKTRILVRINDKQVWVTEQAFGLLLRLAARLKSGHSGWVHGNDLIHGNYHVAIMRLRKQIAPSLKDPASEFIENNGHGAYRISTHPHNVSFNEAKIKALHSELHIHTLLASVGKIASAP